ncbi:ribokinase [Klebsiella pneumoniae]|nr:ribokinase [Klebsiella pneumoniae]
MALIFVNAEGENVIGIHAGANAALSVSQVEAEKERIASAQALLMQLESPLESVIAAAKIAHHHHTTVVLNPRQRVNYRMNCWRWWILLPLTKPKRKS